MIPPKTTAINPNFSFTVPSIPQPGLQNRSITLRAGAVVGGGSAINGMFFDRGSREDYDNWERLGNPGWDFNSLFPYFKKVSFQPSQKKNRFYFCLAFNSKLTNSLIFVGNNLHTSAAGNWDWLERNLWCRSVWRWTNPCYISTIFVAWTEYTSLLIFSEEYSPF